MIQLDKTPDEKEQAFSIQHVCATTNESSAEIRTFTQASVLLLLLLYYYSSLY